MKLDCELAIRQALADAPFEHPFRHPLLERLFLEQDWCKRSIEALRSAGKLWFLVTEVRNDYDGGSRPEWPHPFIYYPLEAYLEQGSPRYVTAANSYLSPGWVWRSWEDCMRKTVKRFEKKVKADMGDWCRSTLTHTVQPSLRARTAASHAAWSSTSVRALMKSRIPCSAAPGRNTTTRTFPCRGLRSLGTSVLNTRLASAKTFWLKVAEPGCALCATRAAASLSIGDSRITSSLPNSKLTPRS